jgi:hypothetical protein
MDQEGPHGRKITTCNTGRPEHKKGLPFFSRHLPGMARPGVPLLPVGRSALAGYPAVVLPKFNRDLLVIPAILAELYHILRRDKFSVVGFPAYIAVFPVSAVFFLLYDLTRLLMIPIRLFVILKAEYTFSCASSSARSSGWCPPQQGPVFARRVRPWERTFSLTWFSCTPSNG